MEEIDDAARRMSNLTPTESDLARERSRLLGEIAAVHADLRCEAGSIFIAQGLRKEGADWLLTALRCDPSHRKTHELLAQYHAEAGNQSLAAHHRLMAAQAPPRQKPAESR